MKLASIDLDGPVHYADFGGSGPPVVLIHGLGGSHLNWASVAPLLRKRRRVLAVDLPGFGFSPPLRTGTTFEGTQDRLERFLEQVVGEPAVVMGNSMGGLLSMLVTAHRPDLVEQLVLVGPAQPVPSRRELDPITVATFFTYAMPGLGDFFVNRASQRLGPEGLVKLLLSRCCVDPSRVEQEVIRQHVELVTRRAAEMPWVNREFLRAARYLIRMVLLRPEILHEAARRIRVPTLIIHGRHDLLVPVAASIELVKRLPHFHLSIMEDAGHTPQLEHPRRLVEIYNGWAESLALRATA